LSWVRDTDGRSTLSEDSCDHRFHQLIPVDNESRVNRPKVWRGTNPRTRPGIAVPTKRAVLRKLHPPPRGPAAGHINHETLKDSIFILSDIQ
jgi:hypothetical protein